MSRSQNQPCSTHRDTHFSFQILVYVIDHASATYEYYKGSTSVYKGELRNMYVRLRRQTTGVGHHFYYDTTLNGFMVTFTRIQHVFLLSGRECVFAHWKRIFQDFCCF